jgi:hypothetical protein
MAKYWFGSLELLGDQHDEKGHIKPTSMKAVKGWKVAARENYPAEPFLYSAAVKKDRDQLAETWWAEAEIWWSTQQINKDLKGNVADDRELDYTPIRETGDYQLRITGPVEVPPLEPAKAKDVPKKAGKL